MNCITCNTVMRPLFTGFYCVNDCDRKPVGVPIVRNLSGGPMHKLAAYIYPSNATKFNHGQAYGTGAPMIQEPCVWDNCSQQGCAGLIETKRVVVYTTLPSKEAGFVTLCRSRPLGVSAIDTVTMQDLKDCVEDLLGRKASDSHLVYYVVYP